MIAKPSAPHRNPIGRPPAGAREGERVKDYPQLSVRLPPEIKARLEAISTLRAQPQWRVVSAAISRSFDELSAAEKRAAGVALVDAARHQRGERNDELDWIDRLDQMHLKAAGE